MNQTATINSNPNSPYWQTRSAQTAQTLAKLLDWSAYDAFFAALEGQSHQQIALAAESKIAELRKTMRHAHLLEIA